MMRLEALRHNEMQRDACATMPYQYRAAANLVADERDER